MSISRRKFLGAAAIGAGATVVGSTVLSGESLAEQAQSTPDPIRAL